MIMNGKQVRETMPEQSPAVQMPRATVALAELKEAGLPYGLWIDEIQGGYATADGSMMAASALQDAETSQDQERIDHAVSRLPEEQERVVRMTFFEGLTQTEIAAKLGVPLGTVKTRVRLAFAKLRDSLAEMRERNR